MSHRESKFQNERHSSSSANKPFLNRIPFSRSRQVNSIRYYSNWLDTFQIDHFPSKSNKLNRLSLPFQIKWSTLPKMVCWYTIPADKTQPWALPFPRGATVKTYKATKRGRGKSNYTLIYVPRIWFIHESRAWFLKHCAHMVRTGLEYSLKNC